MKLIQSIQKEGRVDILVNNAGNSYAVYGPLEEITVEQVKKTI